MTPIRTLRQAAAVGLALSVVLNAMAVRAQSCPAMQEPETSFSSDEPSSVIATHIGLAGLKQLAAGEAARHQPLGLYRAEIKVGLRLDFGVWQRGPNACVWVRGAHLRALIADRTIHVAKEYHRNSCEFHAILDHEIQHARIDNLVLQVHSRPMQEALRQAAIQSGVVGPLPLADVSRAQETLSQALDVAFRTSMQALIADRNRRQASIDTPEEYARVAGLCPSRLRLDQ